MTDGIRLPPLNPFDQGGIGNTIKTFIDPAAILLKQTPPDIPKPTEADLPPPTALPDPEAQRRAQRRSIAQQLSRRGRASTVLTDSDTLGGG